MTRINNNSVSLAGEFAVLSQLSLRGYDANMMLGHTKGVDILLSNPKNDKMYRLEVKTNFRNNRSETSLSKIFGRSVSSWMMDKKQESSACPTLFYCFVNISKDANRFRFYILPSRVVARYVAEQHALWLSEKEKEGKQVTDTDMRVFRIGLKSERYPIATPVAEDYENNWDFAR